ncbi:DUF1836 domain-containing protein [Oceanobacillus damuensis]|uniref:DUF1836 domain-containing protein n=1 Tax=Oceanobacillus damuensis TaxID=937928 RepID=UPI000830C94B|nr:DUF1836 domain-containing protein [Oceanobacillus damuensis]
MKNENDLIESLNLSNQLTLEDIPNIDLYMDQVIQLFENKFADSKRNDEEKVLTKTMINNYAKGKLFFPIKNKKYSKEHLILISLIYQMKGALSINDVKLTLEELNAKVPDGEIRLQDLYRSYLDLMDKNNTMFKEDIKEHMIDVNKKVKELNQKDEAYLEQLLLVSTFSSMSNYYRRAAEKMVDDMRKDSDKDET